jgi:hypothetical protein
MHNSGISNRLRRSTTLGSQFGPTHQRPEVDIQFRRSGVWRRPPETSNRSGFPQTPASERLRDLLPRRKVPLEGTSGDTKDEKSSNQGNRCQQNVRTPDQRVIARAPGLGLSHWVYG